MCDRLDEQAIKLTRYEQSHDSAGARRKHRRITQIGADIRDIDRMMHALSSRLLGVHEQQSNWSPCSYRPVILLGWRADPRLFEDAGDDLLTAAPAVPARREVWGNW